MSEFKIESKTPLILNRLPCAIDDDDCGDEVDMTWFNLTKRNIKG